MISILNRRFVQPLMAWRAGSRHLHYLKLLRARQFDDPETIQARQFDAVRQLLTHAYETVPHYRSCFEQRGLHPSDIRRLDDLELLPVLTKTDIRKRGAALRSTQFSREALFHKKTSGSTGVPLEIKVNRESLQWKTACTIRSDEWSGYVLGGRVAKVWGNPEYRRQGWKGRIRNFLVDRARYLDTIGIDDDRMREFARSLVRKQPSLLFGHAHSLYLFACFVRKHFPAQIRPAGIISTAMILHDWQRTVIEDAFGCPATNRYGCEEVSLIACECERHNGLHLNADSIYAEVIADRPAAALPDDQSKEPPEYGGASKAIECSLVVTDLTNLAMPLIRYKVGDVVVPTSRRCDCGRGLPLIERVEGREADYVLTPSGKLISGISLTENFALCIRGAAQVQIVQDAVNHLRLRMVTDDVFDVESRRQIETLVRQTFGWEMGYEIELVDAIPQESSGKYRFCVSNLANDHLRALAS
jgi:phenylacetate-CoA ligase